MADFVQLMDGISGNVVACSSGNTTKLYTDFDLGNLVVQEIS